MQHGYCTHDGFTQDAASSAIISNCTIIGRRSGGFAHATGFRQAGLTPLIVTGCARRIAPTLR